MLHATAARVWAHPQTPPVPGAGSIHPCPLPLQWAQSCAGWAHALSPCAVGRTHLLPHSLLGTHQPLFPLRGLEVGPQKKHPPGMVGMALWEQRVFGQLKKNLRSFLEWGAPKSNDQGTHREMRCRRQDHMAMEAGPVRSHGCQAQNQWARTQAKNLLSSKMPSKGTVSASGARLWAHPQEMIHPALPKGPGPLQGIPYKCSDPLKHTGSQVQRTCSHGEHTNGSAPRRFCSPPAL